MRLDANILTIRPRTGTRAPIAELDAKRTIPSILDFASLGWGSASDRALMLYWRTRLSAGSRRIQSENTARAFFGIAVAIVAATLGADAPGAEESGTVLSPQALQEIAQVETEINRIEAQAIARLAVPPDNPGPANRAAR